jgi:hypothetical protein
MDRFRKVSDAGSLLATDADEWVAVLDTKTNLMWTVESVQVCNFKAAQEVPATLSTAGFKDWRMPTVEELFLLADRTRVSPAIDTTFFPGCKSDWYWTSTVYAPSPGGYAWFVLFYDGYSGWGNQLGEGFVRAVRAGQ